MEAKLMNVKGASVLIAGLAAVTSGFAETAVWTDTTGETVEWATAAKWQDGSGNPLAAAPNGPTWGVTLPALPGNCLQTIKVGDTSYSLSELVLESLSGTDRHTLKTIVQNRKGLYASSAQPFHLKIANPNGFKGYVTASESFTTLDFDTTASFVPRYEHVSDSQYLIANVTNAGTRAEIGELYGLGALAKRGPGLLAIESSDGVGNTIFLEQGELELGDADPVDVEALINTAALRLDAKKAETLLTDTRDGYAFVTNWLNANGGALYAVAPTRAGFNPPFISAARSPTDLPLVDFGELATVDSSVPTNCYLRLTREIADGREFFYAGYYTRRNLNPVFGSENWQYYRFHQESDRLYNLNNAAAGITRGDIAFDGEKRDSTYNPGKSWYRMHVQSVGASQPVDKTEAIGTDRAWNVTGRTGGMRLGEVLVFTQELTTKERRAINRYLRKKWCGEAEGCDFGTVFVKGSANAITVPAGAVTTIHRVYTDGCTLVKKGDGELRIGAILPVRSSNDATAIQQAASVIVEGGKVSVTGAGLPAAAPTGPAGDPLIWLDASSGPFDLDADNAHVDVWYDCREQEAGSQYVRARMHAQSDGTSAYTGNKPFLAPNAFNGRQAMNFGTTADNNNSWMTFVNPNGSLFRGYIAHEGYLVFCVNTSSKDWPIFGSTTTQLGRNYYTAFAPEAHSNVGDTQAARWTLDGQEIDPSMVITNRSGTKVGFQSGVCHVASYSADVKILNDLLAKDRLDQNIKAGDMKIAECILYDRPLTDAERRQTEAYLMNKWQGKEHPDRLATMTMKPMLTFGDDADAAFHVTADTALERIPGGNGNLVKTGPGALTVFHAEESKVSSIAVAGGDVTLGYGDEFSTLLTPAWRFDASDPQSLETYTGSDEKTYVSKWTASGENLYSMEACRYANDKLNGKSGTAVDGSIGDPTLGMCEMRDGVTRPYLDFGKMSKTGQWGYLNAGTAGFRINEVGQDGGSVPYNMCWVLGEAYAVVADADTRTVATEYGTFFGTANRNDYRCDFLRGSNGALFDSGAKQGVRDGYMAIDGAVATKDDALPPGFHLVSVQPVVTNTTIDRYRIDAIGLERNISAGGVKVAELVAYKGQHTPRQRAFIEQSLMHKWFGTPAPVWSHELTSLSVAEGSTLTVTGRDLVFSTPLLAGAGKIVAECISGVSALTVPGDRNGVGTLTVDGTVRFADAVSVTVDADEAVGHGGAPYTILTATSLENVDLANWTVDVSFKGSRRAKLTKVGNEIRLVVEKPGFVIIVR